MLKRIRLENFKSIKFWDYQCVRLNLLMGLNGSGKSSFIQFLNFLRAYASKDLEPQSRYFCKELGLSREYGDIRYCYAMEDEQVAFRVDFEAKENFVWHEGEEQSGSLDRVILNDIYEGHDGDNILIMDKDVYKRELSFFAHAARTTEDREIKLKKQQEYFRSVRQREKLMQSAFRNVWEDARMVDAFRRKPINVHIGSGKYGLMEEATHFNTTVDPEGGDVVEFLYKFGRIVRLDQANPMIYPGSKLHNRKLDVYEEIDKNQYIVEDPLIFEHDDGSHRMYTTLSEQVDAWLNVVSPGARLNVSRRIVGDEEWYLETVGFGERNHAKVFRPQNVGFGISYVLPVLVAILTARPTDIVIIENPEAHLHPKGQSGLGKLLARAASYGVQLFVETHSDHVINGVRVAVKQGILSPNDVNVAFFDRHYHKVRYSDGIRGEYYADICNIKIDRNGMLSNYPKGFMDEWNNQYYQLHR